MDIKYTNYEIDTCDIYDYECQLIEAGKHQTELLKEILEAFEIIMLKNEDAIFSTYHPSDQEENSYYIRNLTQYESAKHSLIKRFKLGFFCLGNNMYDLQCFTTIEKENTYYPFFFALKIRQYESDTNHLFDLLKYQKKINFHKQAGQFKQLLQNKIIKYAFIPQAITDLIQEWIDKNLVEHKFEIPELSSGKKDLPLLINELITYKCIKPVISDQLIVLTIHNRLQNQINWTDADWKLGLLIKALQKATLIQLLPDETIFDFINAHFTYKGKKFNQRILADNYKRSLKIDTQINVYKKYSASIEKAFHIYSSNIQQK